MSGWRTRLVNSLALTQDIPESRFFQLATQSPDGQLHNRTVVFRGLDETQDVLYLVTDTRSQKCLDFQCNRKAAVCWYFAHSREQYRFSVTGEVCTVHSHESLCSHYWAQLSESAKSQFFWGEPGSARNNPEYPLKIVTPSTQIPPSHFAVIKLTVQNADYLSLTGNPQIRERFELQNGQWICQPILP
ncbi:pyridoxamine 5'-phosphate oxidase family protein [Alteromonas sp. AMM-1]|uniref:pyridoxamine 5'-phosphate oxidase family protein n=1 Tax=Alteromonas sp. AMM-1 TaxID=3394233 RepID=UPI0039A4FC70